MMISATIQHLLICNLRKIKGGREADLLMTEIKQPLIMILGNKKIEKGRTLLLRKIT